MSRTNQKLNYGGFLGYLETWFQPNGMGNILSFSKVEKLFVITYDHKEKIFVVHTKGEDNEEGKVYFHNIPEGLPFVDLQEYEDSVSMVTTARKNYIYFKSAEIKRADAACKELGLLGNPMVDDFEKMVRANQIQNSPISSKDITNAKFIFGTHLAGVRGKKLRHTSKWVDSDCV